MGFEEGREFLLNLGHKREVLLLELLRTLLWGKEAGVS